MPADAADSAKSADSADSAGTPWSGRVLTGTGFDDDTGTADPALLAAITARAAAPSADADARLVRAAAEARWLVPVVAVAGSVEHGEHELQVERSTDMALVTMTAPDGRAALPAFTSSATLATWDPTARPVPVSGARLAQAAVAEGCQVVVADLGTETPAELRPSMVWALAMEREWLPAHADPFVAESVSRAVVPEREVVEHRLQEGMPRGQGVLRVVLAVRSGLDAAGIQELASRIGGRLATDGELRARVDELTFAVEPAGEQ